MRRRTLALLSLATIALAAPSARAEMDRAIYATPHPLATSGWCGLAEVHTHAAPPPAELAHLYRSCGEAWCFVGDPVPFGYTGDALAYDGHHPVVVAPAALVIPIAPVAVAPAVVVIPTVAGPSVVAAQTAHELGYCFLAGLHYHAYAPDPSLAAWYAFFSGAWVYRGPVRVEVYKRERERYERREPSWTKLPAYRNAVRRVTALYSAAARRRLAASFGRLRRRALGLVPGASARRTYARTQPRRTHRAAKR